MDATRQCPYCAETVRAEATLCRHCRSRIVGLDPARWHRDHPERRVAGVATAVAHALALPLGGVRLGFILLTFFHFLGPALYGALWLVIPFAPGDEPPFARALARGRGLVDAARGPGTPARGPSGPEDGGRVPGEPRP